MKWGQLYLAPQVRLLSDTQWTQKDHFGVSLPLDHPPHIPCLVRAVYNCLSCLNAPRQHQTVLVVQNQYLSAQQQQNGSSECLLLIGLQRGLSFSPQPKPLKIPEALTALFFPVWSPSHPHLRSFLSCQYGKHFLKILTSVLGLREKQNLRWK